MDAAPIIRSRRLDTHAVIKHVTATLLEVRPGFASSPTITEMSATAIEGLVFMIPSWKKSSKKLVLSIKLS